LPSSLSIAARLRKIQGSDANFIQINSLDRRINHSYSSFQKSMLPLAEEPSCLSHMSQSIQAPLQQIKTYGNIKESKNRGIIIAFLVIGIWASSLVFLLSLNISKVNFLWLLPVILSGGILLHRIVYYCS